MTSIELSPQTLFDGFPEPVLLLEGSCVRYYNPAALRLFPDLKENETLPAEPEALLGNLTGQAVLLSRHGGIAWRISVQALEDGRSLALFRAMPEEDGGPRADRLAQHLRQQTTGLSAALQVLGTARALDGARRGQYLSLANQGLYRLERLAEHLEFLDRADRDLYRPAAMDLAGLCREVSDAIEGVCRPCGYRFQYESDLTGLLTQGDDVLLRRMLLGLLSNAMKAAGPQGRFGLRLVRQGKRAVLTVWDEGDGLGQDGMGVLFGGEGVRLPCLDPSEGLGLGLPAVRRVAALHGGTVMIESRPGDGLRAVVSLPIRPPEHTPLRAPEVHYGGGAFSPVLVELSDLLPPTMYAFEDLE